VEHSTKADGTDFLLHAYSHVFDRLRIQPIHLPIQLAAFWWNYKLTVLYKTFY